jgi:hypothetical protein
VSLGQVGVKAAENKLENTVEQAVVSLGQVGVKAAENKFENAALRAAESLGPVDEGLRNSRGQGQGSRVYSDG